MKRVATYQLVPGMKLAEDVYNFQQQLILPKGTVLTDDIITRLDFYSIISVYVADTEESEISVSAFEETSDSYFDKMQAEPHFQDFKKTYNFQISDFRDVINDVITKNTELKVETLLQKITSIINSSNGPFSLFDMLHNLRQYSDATYTHSMNVALICHTFANWLNFSPEDTQTATLCGLLHDIGKLMIPLDILNKPAKLTESEYNTVKKHPIYGYRTLTGLKVSPAIATAALLHHEKYDGSGYPYGITGERLDKFSKMVTIADVYDATTSARIYRGPLCPFRVLELFHEEGYQKYDTEYLLTFLSHIANTYLSYRVRLSNGQEGDVIYINKQNLGRPTVKCGPEYIDLSARSDLQIISFV